jgi:hypothetical protein
MITLEEARPRESPHAPIHARLVVVRSADSPMIRASCSWASATYVSGGLIHTGIDDANPAPSSIIDHQVLADVVLIALTFTITPSPQRERPLRQMRFEQRGSRFHRAPATRTSGTKTSSV